MKKLRVILPAILTLAVSTSAAVTGTVAWFTATRLRTIDMTGVTVVNPEAGLLMTSATNKANTQVEFNEGAQSLSVTHGKVNKGTEQDPVWDDVYLRDGSVDVENDNVYRAVVSEAGVVTGYDEVDEPYSDVNGKTYDGKAIAYATKFEVGFKTTAVPPAGDNINNCLFLNVETSTVTAPTQIKANTNVVPDRDAELLKSVRIGFFFDNEWFVWAPLADGYYKAFDITSSNFESKKTSLFTKSDDTYTSASSATFDAGTTYYYKCANYTYVNGEADETADPVVNTLASREHAYETEEIIIGHNGPENDTTVEDSGALNDSEGSLGKTAAEAYAGYLGVLTGDEKKLTVYTWFEGTDETCVETNFTTVLKDIQSTLRFVMRRVAKS